MSLPKRRKQASLNTTGESSFADAAQSIPTLTEEINLYSHVSWGSSFTLNPVFSDSPIVLPSMNYVADAAKGATINILKEGLYSLQMNGESNNSTAFGIGILKGVDANVTPSSQTFVMGPDETNGRVAFFYGGSISGQIWPHISTVVRLRAGTIIRPATEEGTQSVLLFRIMRIGN